LRIFFQTNLPVPQGHFLNVTHQSLKQVPTTFKLSAAAESK